MKVSEREQELLRIYAEKAKAAGVPADQFANYTRAGIVLNPKQLLFAAAARSADKPDGAVELGFGGGLSGGKGLRETENVLTPFGWKPIGTLKPGDKLCATDGTVTHVLQVFHRGKQEFYRCHFADGTHLDCDADHLWYGWRVKTRKIGNRRTSGEDAARIYAMWELIKLVGVKGKRFAIPTNEPVAFNVAGQLIGPGTFMRRSLSPYALGVLLGNGSITTTSINFTTPFSEVGDEMRKELREHCTISEYQYPGCLRFNIQSGGWIQDRLRELKLLGLKSHLRFIPKIYLYGTVKERWALLQGLMDTDGTADKDGDIYFCSTSRVLIDGVIHLARSLGAIVTEGCKLAPRYTYNGELRFGRTAWNLRLKFRDNKLAFRVAFKRDRAKSDYNSNGRWMTRIEKLKPARSVCIAVAHPNSLFIAKDFIVTHNTFCMLAQIGADDCQRFPGLKCLLLRKSGESNRENMNDVRLKAFSRIPHSYASVHGIITFANGSRILAGHFQAEKDIDKYLGLEYDIIAVEEATTLSAQKYRHISTRNRTSKTGFRPRMYSTTNPGGIGHLWYKNKFIVPMKNGRETTTRFIRALALDNPHNNPEYIPALMRNLSGWEKRAWLDGDWDIAAGQYFTNFRVDLHQVDFFDDAKGVQWFAALDYGFTHYTVCHLGCEDSDGNVFIVDEHAARGLLPEAHADAIHSMLARHKQNVRSLVRFCCGTDLFAKESTGKTVAQQYNDLGIRMTPANVDRINGASEMLKLLGDPERKIPVRLKIHKRCALLLEQIPEMQHDPKRPEDVLKVNADTNGEGGDDAYDCARMLLATRTHTIRAVKLAGF